MPGKLMAEAEAHVPAFMGFPSRVLSTEHWKQIASTNPPGNYTTRKRSIAPLKRGSWGNSLVSTSGGTGRRLGNLTRTFRSAARSCAILLSIVIPGLHPKVHLAIIQLISNRFLSSPLVTRRSCERQDSESGTSRSSTLAGRRHQAHFMAKTSCSLSMVVSE